METTRQPKIARQIQRDIADIFQKEGRDLLLGTLVTDTEVRVSPDFNYAKIYVSIFPFDKAPNTMAVLDKQNRFIRRELGRRIKDQLKTEPEIQFFLDDSLEYIEHLEQAMKEDK